MDSTRRTLLIGAGALTVGGIGGYLLGRFPPDLALPTGGTPEVAIPEAKYLPQFDGAKLSIAYGIRNLVEGNTKPLIQVMRASDLGASTMDVPQLPDGRCDDAAVVEWAGDDETRISIFYNHTGSGLDTPPISWATAPIYDARKLYDETGKCGPFTSAIHDGWKRNASETRYPKYFELPASFTSERQSVSVFDVADPKSSLYNTSFWSLSDVFGGDYNQLGAVLSGGLPGFTASSASDASSGLRARQNYQVLGIANNSAACRIFQDDKIILVAAKGAGSIVGGTIGCALQRASGTSDFMDGSNRLAFVIYNGDLTDDQGEQIIAALQSNFGLKLAGTGRQVIMSGDSNHYGATVSETLSSRTLMRETRALAKFDADFYNMALSSQQLLGKGGMMAMAPTREDLLLAQGNYSDRFLLSLVGGNDLSVNGDTPGFGAALYDAHYSYIADKRAKGATGIVVGTIPVRGNFTTGQQAIEWADYNARVRANAAGADRIADLAAEPLIGDPANLSNPMYFQGDNVHWTGLGNHLLAPILAEALNALS